MSFLAGNYEEKEMRKRTLVIYVFPVTFSRSFSTFYCEIVIQLELQHNVAGNVFHSVDVLFQRSVLWEGGEYCEVGHAGDVVGVPI